MSEKEYYNVICKECGRLIKIVCYIIEGYADYEKIYCPYCGNFLGEYRAEAGYYIKEDKEYVKA